MLVGMFMEVFRDVKSRKDNGTLESYFGRIKTYILIYSCNQDDMPLVLLNNDIICRPIISRVFIAPSRFSEPEFPGAFSLSININIDNIDWTVSSLFRNYYHT